jgi:coenzyme F420 hydrogenase subunit beta
MESVEPGYNRPVQSGGVTREAEQIIAGSCPGARVAPWPEGETTHPYWGPFRQVLTGHASRDDIRFEGSSGGAITGLLVHALEAGLIDRVVHVGPSPSDPTRNATLVSRTAAEIIARAGSRYVASSPLEHIEAELAAGGAFAFVGKPCDASALRQLARRDPRVDRHVPLVLSFFCAGIPSHAGVGRILKKMQVAAEAVTEFRFRGRGWPGDCVAVTPKGEAHMSYADSWGGFLSKETQFRCKICPDAIGGVADIACADAWYGDEEGYPSFDEEEGRSLIISRTEAGERLLQDALSKGALSVEPLPIGEIEKMQPGQARRKRLVLARTLALPFALQPRPRMRGLQLMAAARRAPLPEALKNLLGTFRRTILGRRSRL